MTDIKYITGDATRPVGDGKKIIIHVCNNCRPGAWGSGFVLAISKLWKQPEVQYRKWSKGHISTPKYELGQVQFVKVEDDIVIGNMIGQDGIGMKKGVPPIRYSAIDKCLEKVGIAALRNDATIHAPRFGSDRAGGDWDKIEELIIKNISSKNIEVTIYDLK